MHQDTSGGRKEDTVVERGRQVREIARSQARRSQCGVLTEDNLQLSAVQFASIWQSHDALLVPHKSCCVHILPARRWLYIEKTQSVDTLSSIRCYKHTVYWLQRHHKQLSSIFGQQKATWTELIELPFCSCHRGPSAKHLAPAHQYSHCHPDERDKHISGLNSIEETDLLKLFN